MTSLVNRFNLRRSLELASASLVSVVTGGVIAVTNASLAAVGALAIAIATIAAFVASVESLVMLLLVTSPIGLEQLTNNRRNFLTSFGGFDVASLRLVILFAAGGVILGLRGLPRRLLWQEKAYAALIVWLLVSLAFSPNVFGGIRYTGKLAILLVTWLTFSWVIPRYGQAAILRLLLVMLALVLLCDYTLLATGLGYTQKVGVSRFGGVAAAPATGAVSLAALALVALYAWLKDQRPLALLLYLLAWGPVILSVTRIAIIGFLVTSVFLAILMGRQRQALTILLLILTVTVSYAPLRERMAFGSTSHSWQSVLSAFQTQGVHGINTEGRLNLWTPLVAQVKRSPLAGSGAGESEFIVKAVTHETQLQAHSDYLAILVNGGIIAGILWLISLGGLAVRFMKQRQIGAVASAVLLLYFITALTDNAIEMYAALGIPLAMLIALAFEQEKGARDLADRARAQPR